MQRLITRGFGGSATSIITAGFGKILEEVVRVIRKGQSAAKRLAQEIEQSLKISAMLVAANGKEFVKPIFNTVSNSTVAEAFFKISVSTKHLIARKSKDITVKVNSVTARNRNEFD